MYCSGLLNQGTLNTVPQTRIVIVAHLVELLFRSLQRLLFIA